MYLRNGLIIISILMIAFSLSLYFQADDASQMINWDQYKNLRYNEERSHSLNDFNQKITPLLLEELIQNIAERNLLLGEKTRIMELGSGNGRVLMELKKKFPSVEFYGINKEKTLTFHRRESYILTALKFEIMNKDELQDIVLPYLVFADLDFDAGIPYKDNRFDLIYSQDTMRHIKYKFELWNEVLRVLKPGGISLHTDLSGLNIYDGGVVIEPHDAFLEMRKRGFEIKDLENEQSVMFKKTDQKHLTFPVTPHQPLPDKSIFVSEEQRRPDMGYNLN